MLPRGTLSLLFEYAHDHIPRPLGYRKGYTRGLTSTLLSLARVCKQWKHLAERLLYRKVSLIYPNGFVQNDRCYQILRDNLLRDPRRNNYIKEFTLIYDNNQGAAEDAKLLGHLLQMSRLESLKLEGANYRHCRPVKTEIVTSITFKSIRELDLLEGWWTTPVLAQILAPGHEQITGTLETLKITNPSRLDGEHPIRAH